MNGDDLFVEIVSAAREAGCSLTGHERVLFEQITSTPLGFRATEAFLDDLRAKASKARRKGSTLEVEMRRSLSYHLRSIVPESALVASAVMETRAADPAVATYFSDMWARWPRNDYPQSERKGRAAFEAAVAKHGLDYVRVALERYIDAHLHDEWLGFPKHLSTLLSDDDTVWSLHEQSKVFTPERRAEFEAWWKWVPPYPDKIKDHRRAFGLYLYRIPRAHRWDALVSIKTYYMYRAEKNNPRYHKSAKHLLYGHMSLTHRQRSDYGETDMEQPLYALVEHVRAHRCGPYVADPVVFGAVGSLFHQNVRCGMNGWDLFYLPCPPNEAVYRTLPEVIEHCCGGCPEFDPEPIIEAAYQVALAEPVCHVDWSDASESPDQVHRTTDADPSGDPA